MMLSISFTTAAMWLLHTTTGELRWFNDRNLDDFPTYAILSHVWQEDELSFQGLQALRTQSQSSSMELLSLIPSKIRNCCRIACEYGYEWVWIRLHSLCSWERRTVVDDLTDRQTGLGSP